MNLFDREYFISRETNRVPACSIKGFDDLPILRLETQRQPNVQIDQALNAETYVLDFGERMSPMSLSGVIPLKDSCAEEQKEALDILLEDLYEKHRIGKKPVTVNIGSDTYSAYVTAKSVANASEQPGMLTFSMTLLGIKTGRGEDGDSSKPDSSTARESSGLSSPPVTITRSGDSERQRYSDAAEGRAAAYASGRGVLAPGSALPRRPPPPNGELPK